jgi:hypothetical protein
MALTSQAAADRDLMTAAIRTRSTAMNLMHQELARAQLHEHHDQAQQARRRRALLAHRRWQRRAERAAHRARLALASV